MSNIGYRVIEDFNRPSKELIDGFKGMQAASIGDCMNKTGAMNTSIHQINNQKILGPAYTVKVPSGDNMMIFLAIEKAQPGDVLVIDGEGCMERALVGEVLAKFAKSRNLGGFVINGCIRDFEILIDFDIPVFAKGKTPNGPYRNGPGEINTMISIGNQVVHPGDIIIGDEDGIVVVQPEHAKDVQEKTLALEEREKTTLENIEKGEGLNLDWLYEKLEQDNCEIIKKKD